MKMKSLILTVLAALLLTAALAFAEAAELTCAELADVLQASAEYTELKTVSEKYLEKYLLIDASDLSDYEMRRDATRSTPEMILVLDIREDANLEEIQQAVEDYHEEQILQYRDYQPDQLFKLENAKVLLSGRRLVLAVSPDSAATEAVLGEAYK